MGEKDQAQLEAEELLPCGCGAFNILFVQPVRITTEHGLGCLARARPAVAAKLREMDEKLKQRDRCAYIGAMRDCPTHGESAELATLRAAQAESGLPEDIKSFIYRVTLFLQAHAYEMGEQATTMFQAAYRLYHKYDVEGIRAAQAKEREG